MKACPYCGNQNREGMMFCEECGQSLTGSNTVLPTRKLEQGGNELAAKATWGTARFGQDAFIILHIRDADEPLMIQPAKRTILGRADENSPQKPDMDLTPYGALEKGVSRIHAAIHRSEDTLTLVDMGSANGTHLNGQRLAPDQPRVLRDGDEIRLGKLVAHIYFK
ncbi:MAG: FHA domain-containing protein [Anaerolineae bacterium]|nr:FHA domain-containing protein [Anaerolineae bacterium]